MAHTVLIVDDNELCREALEIVFSITPTFHVRAVGTAREALQCLAGGGISALITDLQLPDGHGYELIREIRADREHSALPILVTSGDIDPETPDRLEELGANAYFLKPYSPAEVRGRLEELIHGS